MPVAVQPQADASGVGDSHEIIQVAEAVAPSFGAAVFQTYGIVGDQNARAARQPSEKIGQPVELRRVDAAAGIPRPTIGRRRVRRDEPQPADTLGEWIHFIIDPLAGLPTGKVDERRRNTISLKSFLNT